MHSLTRLTVAALSLTVIAAVAAEPNKAVIDAAVAAALKAPPALNVRTAVVHNPTKQGLPYVGLQAILITGGYSEANIPCIGCANGGGGFDVSIPVPIGSTFSGAAFTFTTAMGSDITTGSCMQAYVVVPVGGGSPVRGGSYDWTSGGGCSPNSIYLVWFNTTLSIPTGDYYVVAVAKGATTIDKAVTGLHIQ